MQKRTVLLFAILFLLALHQSTLVQGASSAYIYGVPYYSMKQSYWCGPAALQMVLGFWGVNINQSQIASAVYNSTDNSTDIKDMRSYPLNLGFNSTAITGSIEVLKTYIQRGLPTIVLQKISSTDAYGHYRVVVGYDDAKELFTTHDPQFGENYNITYNQFQNLWANGSIFTTTNWTLVIETSSPFSTPSPTPTPSIPEFPSFIVLPSMIAATLIGSLIFKRKWSNKTM